jgi:hypothetical protein
MKIVELTNKLQLPITNEESELLDRFIGDAPIAKAHLDEREQMLANGLTVKDVLLRSNTDGKIYYKKIVN